MKECECFNALVCGTADRQSGYDSPFTPGSVLYMPNFFFRSDPGPVIITSQDTKTECSTPAILIIDSDG